MESHQQALSSRMTSPAAGATSPADNGAAGSQAPRGLYRPSYDHDACGIGAIAQLKGIRSH